MATPSLAGPSQLPAIVTRVIDGDTIEVSLDGRQETVRLIGVDTPETVHPRIGVEPWGPEASAFTKRLLPAGTRVRLELDVQEREVRIERVDLRAEEVVLVNDGAEVVDLSGWQLISVVGNQMYRFPAGTKLKPGERLVVKSGPKAVAGPGVLVWTRQAVWNNNGDPAELRDAAGALIDRYPS